MTRRLRPPRPPLQLPEPGKPPSEMTSAERAAYLRQLRRALRDDQVRRGTRPPSTMREMEIWREGEAQREQWREERIAQAEQRPDPPQSDRLEARRTPEPRAPGVRENLELRWAGRRPSEEAGRS